MKSNFSAKFKYKMDKFLSKGMPALITLLVIISIIFLVIFAGLLFLFAKGFVMPEQAAGKPVWDVFIHMLDPGTITADDTSNITYIIIMIVITLCGLVINSILIGTISNAIDNKLTTLKAGKSKIIEENHTVIIGLSDSAYTMISELIKANENLKRGCIVVVSRENQEEIVDAISAKFPDTKNTEIICRSGNPYDFNILDMCSISSAKSVIINFDDDFDVIKQLMTISKYIKINKPLLDDFHAVAIINQEKNVGPAKIVGEDFAEVVYFKSSLARLIAHSCRYPGISSVFVDFFDLDGDEIYYESFAQLDGMKFKDIIMSFKDSAVIGLVKDGKPILNPPMDTVYNFKNGDQVIHLAEDDNVSFPSEVPAVSVPADVINSSTYSVTAENRKLLVLGYNELLFDILREFDNYVGKDSLVTLVTSNDCCDKSKVPVLNNVNFKCQQLDLDVYDNMAKLLEDGYDTVLLLCDLNMDYSDADAYILTNLVNLRYLIKQKNLKINIISEMRSVENQKISNDGSVSDFVVGSNITSLILTQLSENRTLLPLFEDLLDEDGSELYMKPVVDYVKVSPNTAFDMYQLQHVAEERNEIVIGYKIYNDGQFNIELNPSKDSAVIFSKEDSLIVIAED